MKPTPTSAILASALILCGSPLASADISKAELDSISTPNTVETSIAKGIDVARKNVEANLKVYPLLKKDAPAKLELISGSGKSFNTIHANDYSFYEHLDHVILDPSPDGIPESVLVARLIDQAALSGLLNALYEFHLPLISVECLDVEPVKTI